MASKTLWRRTSSAASRPPRLMPERPCSAERSGPGPPAGIDGLERPSPAAGATCGNKSCPDTCDRVRNLSRKVVIAVE